MTSEKTLSEREIFAAAVKLPVEERAAYLGRACGDDVELRQEVESLLKAHDTSKSFMESPALELPAEADGRTVGYHSLAEGPGTVIGPYKLLQQIGEGGMGVVFMAEQSEPIQRTVALKIIKPGMDTRQVIARFEAERQALALMEHPNIARVLDAGTTDSGRPYFVMELVKGVPITKYCDEKQMSLRARLELVLPVCQAVQHAHQKGIIHRDLKPTNILVAEYDNQAVPKVIDFGVAKATAHKLTERTLFTEFGQVLGTIEYMSPEQAKFNQLDIDTRSDIYSLGVMLYELLTGTTPFERKRLQEAAFDEMLRIIREEEPPKPSTRLSSSEALPSIAANRGLEPLKLNRLVQGELDWIVMKCLEKDRNRRYETANGLAADLQHYLQDEPVQACPPSAAYRVRKFARRNKVAIATVTIVICSLMLAATVSIWQAAVAHRAEKVAQARLVAETAARRQATAITELFQEALEAANPDSAKGADYSVRELLDDMSARLSAELKDQPAAEASMRSTIGNAYRRLEMQDAAAPHLARALEIRQKLLGPAHESVALSLYDEAWNLNEGADYSSAIERMRRAMEIHTKHGARNADTVKFLALQQLILFNQGEYEESQRIGRDALDLVEDLGAPSPEAANVLHRLAGASRVRGRFAEAEQLARDSIPLHRKLHGDHHPETAYGLAELADALIDQQRSDEAEPYYREAFSIFSRQYAGLSRAWLAAFERWASILNTNGKPKEVEQLRADVVARVHYSRQRRPDDVTLLAQAMAALRTVGDVDEAIAVGSQLLAKNGQDSKVWAARGDCYRVKEDFARMAQDYSQAIKLRKDDHWYWHERAYAYMMLGEHEQAVADHTIAIELKDRDAGQRLRRACSYHALGDFEKSVEDCRQALELSELLPIDDNWSWVDAARRIVSKPVSDPAVAELAVRMMTKAIAKFPNEWFAKNTLGLAYYRAGEFEKAVKALEESMTLRSGGDSFDWFVLAMANRRLGKQSQAQQWYDKAVAWMERAKLENAELRHFRAEADILFGVSESQSSIDRQRVLNRSPPTNNN